MKRGLGFNMFGLRDDERALLLNYYKRTNPPLAVVMDDYPFAVELAQACPDTVVVFRRFVRDDWWKDNPPERWIELHTEYTPIPRNLWFYMLNEAPPHGPALAQWLTRCTQLAIARGWRVVVGNWSVGMPPERDWHIYHDLLKLAHQHPQQVIIGLHEYWPTLATYEAGRDTNPANWPRSVPYSTYLVGRVWWLRAYLVANGLTNARIAITEHGSDRVDAALAWQQYTPGYGDKTGYQVARVAWNVWKPADMSTGEYAARQFQWVHDVFYKHLPGFVGVATFCGGGLGDWRRYFNALEEDFLNAIEQHCDFSVKGSEPVNIISNGTKLEKRVIGGNVTVNIRAQPTTAAAIRGTLTTGMVIDVYVDSEARAHDLKWQRLANGNWFALVGGLSLNNPDSAKAKLRELHTQLGAIHQQMGAVIDALPE